MRIVIAANLALAWAGLGAAADLTSRAGVAVQTPTGVCLSMANSGLKPGDPVTLVAPGPPQTVIEAKVSAKTEKGCPGVTDASVSGYQLQVTSGTAPDFEPLIAVAEAAAGFHMDRGAATARLEGKSGSQAFRSCTSAEGVHLTIWQGKPLKSKRLWHQYYYLGQDLEQTCKAKDFAK